MIEFRLLRADEIEARVAMVKENGLQILLYKDARCDMAILDETVGPFGWQRHHSRDNANCTVAIYDAQMDAWIEKEDTGTESNTEAEKGLASDSFKRACVNWGIGRELYTAPFCWFTPADANIKGTKCYDRFDVVGIEYDGRRIASVTVKNENTGAVKTFGKAPQKAPVNPRKPKAEPKPETPPVEDRSKLQTVIDLCARDGIAEPLVAALYGMTALEDLGDQRLAYTIKNWDLALEKIKGGK